MDRHRCKAHFGTGGMIAAVECLCAALRDSLGRVEGVGVGHPASNPPGRIRRLPRWFLMICNNSSRREQQVRIKRVLYTDNMIDRCC